MPELSFLVEKAEAEPFAASPLLLFKVRIGQAAPVPIHAVALKCQVRIEPAQRRYTDAEKERLSDLFGSAERWGRTLRSLLWAHTSVIVPPFAGETEVDLPVPCTFDFNVATTKYFDALTDGEIPLSLLFSGTVFYDDDEQGLQVAQISWDKEAPFRLPVRVWKEMMHIYYPNTAWLALQKDVFDHLHDYKTRSGLPTWEEALESLLSAATAERGV